MELPIPYARQTISEADIQAVVDVLRGSWLTQGPKIQEFEKALAEYCGAKYAVLVANGTAALHLACLALDLKPEDEVLTSPITFAASSNAVLYAGAKPVFVDIDPDSFNLDPEKVFQYLKKNPQVKAIIPVHFAGVPVEMTKIHHLAKEFKLRVIEDACHSLGGQWRDEEGKFHKIGSCSHSDMVIFSFHPAKQLTTGEGGAILTNDPALYAKLSLLRTHGINKNPEQLSQNHGAWFHEMQELGFNYRITDFQAALGLSQLKELDLWVARRREIADRYDKAFSPIKELGLQKRPQDASRLSYHLYVIQYSKRKGLYDYLVTQKILTQVHYIPVHKHPFYKKHFNYEAGTLANAEAFYEKALSLPMYPSLTNEQVDYVIAKVKAFVQNS